MKVERYIIYLRMIFFQKGLKKNLKHLFDALRKNAS